MLRTILLHFFILTSTSLVNAGARISIRGLSNCENLTDSSKAVKYFQSGHKKYLSKDYAGSIEDFSKVLDLEPANWQAFRHRGDAQSRLGHFDLGIADYTNAILLNRSDFLSYMGRAEAERSISTFEKALNDYDVCLELSPKDYDAHYGRGICYYELHLYKQSIDNFSFCIESNPNLMSSYARRGFGYFFDSQYKKAIVDFNRYLRLGGSGKGNDIFFYRGASYFQLNPKNKLYADSAILDLQKYQAVGSLNNEANCILGGAYAAKGDSTTARRYFRKSVALEPDDFVYSLWGKSELNFNNNRKALELLNKAIALAKSPESDLFYDLGVAKIRLCDLTGALNEYEKAIELDSLNVDAYEARFIAVFRNSKYNEVILGDINHLIHFSKSKERTADLYSARSLINLRAKKGLEAKKDIEKAIEIDSANPLHYIVRGLIRTALGENITLVLSDYDRAEKINNKLWQTYLAKGYFYREQGDPKKACEYLKKAVKHGAKITENIQDYICTGKNVDTLNGRESALVFIAYNYLLKSSINGDSKTIDCSDTYKQ